jgi:hypothetical protein
MSGFVDTLAARRVAADVAPREAFAPVAIVIFWQPDAPLSYCARVSTAVTPPVSGSWTDCGVP